MNNSIYQIKFKETQSMFKAINCLIEIIDAKYEKVNLRAITKEECLNHLSATEKDILLKLLQEDEELFDRTLGVWDCNPVSLQLKEGAPPYHGRPFPIPKKHVETLKKGNLKTMQLGDIEVANRF